MALPWLERKHYLRNSKEYDNVFWAYVCRLNETVEINLKSHIPDLDQRCETYKKLYNDEKLFYDGWVSVGQISFSAKVSEK